jgi:hypothetical protein
MFKVTLHRINSPELLRIVDEKNIPIGIEVDLTKVNCRLFCVHPPFSMHKVRNGKGTELRFFLKALAKTKNIKSITFGLKTTNIDLSILRSLIEEITALGISISFASTSLSYLRELRQYLGKEVRLQYLLWLLPIFELFQMKNFVNLKQIAEVADEIATWFPNNDSEAQKIMKYIAKHKLTYFPGGIDSRKDLTRLFALQKKHPKRITGAYLNELNALTSLNDPTITSS